MKKSVLLLPICILCSALPLFLWGQPTNDECTNAIPLTIADNCVPQIFSNVDATQSNTGDIPDCFNGGAIDRDVWFTFNVPTNGDIENIKVTVEKVAENSIDLPQIALYRGSCEAGELSDVGLCTSAELLEDAIEIRALGLTPGIQYFLRVNDYSETALPNWGNFSICIEDLPPVFNMGEVPGTNLCEGTLYDSGGPDGAYADLEEATFAICPNDFHQCIQINVETYRTEEDFDQLFIFDGEGNDLEFIRAVSGEGFQTVANVGSGCVTIGFVSDFLIQDEGFKLTWKCTPSICPPQEERSCTNPNIINSLPFSQDNLTTCLSGNNIEDGPCSNDAFLEGDDYVFAYTSAGDECISISVTGVIPGAGISVFRGCPNDNTAQATCFAQDNDADEGVLNITNISLREADTYYFVIAQETNCTPFNISITPSSDCPMVFPSAAQCDNALLLNGCDTDLPAALTVEPGQGDVEFFQLDVNNGCWDGVLETNYTWFTFEAQADGEFAFLLSNNIQDEALDIDFNIWGPFQSVENACTASFDSQPIRSSWADDLLSTVTGLTNINPVLGTPVTDVCEGALSDGFIQPIDVKKGEVYVVLVNDFDGVIFNGAVAIDFSESSTGVLGAIEEAVSVSDDTGICIGANTPLNATGGSLYEWSPKEGLSCSDCPNPIASPNATTTYSVQINTVCSTISKSVTVEVYDLEAGPPSTVCLGEVIALNVSDNQAQVQFEWMVSASDNPLSCTDCATPTIMATTPGSFQYTVKMTTPLCELRDTYELTVLDGMAFDFVLQDDQSICRGTTVNVGGEAFAGNSYTWTDINGATLSSESDFMVTPDTTTTYFLKVENASCAAPALNSVTVEVFDQPVLALIGDTTVCQGANLRLSNTLVQEGVDYQWSSANNTFSSTQPNPIIFPEVADTYFVSASKGNCMTEASLTVEVIPIEVAFQQSEDTLGLCLGETLTLNPSTTPVLPPTIKNLIGELDTVVTEIEVSPTNNAIYTATISNAGCMATATLTVRVDSLPTNMVILPSDTTVCEGEELILQSPLYDPVFFPDIQHLWMPDAGFETPDSLYNLVLTASDSVILMRTNTNGICVDTSIAIINVNPIEDIPISPADPSICIGTRLTLMADIPEGVEQLMWMPEGATSCMDCPNPTVSPVMSTNFSLQGMLNDCPVSGSVFIDVIDGATATISSDSPNEIFQGESINAIVSATDEIASIEWLEDGQVISGLSGATITYVPLANENLNETPRTVTIIANVTTVDGCVNPVSLSFLVTPPIETMPNAFTPDGDGTNDFFNLIIQGPPATITSFKIYDRWGKQVYNNDTPSQGWDGRYQGERQNPDVYVYVIEYQVGERVETRSGDVTLIR